MERQYQPVDRTTNCRRTRDDNLFRLFTLSEIASRRDCRHNGRDSVYGPEWQGECILGPCRAREDHKVSNSRNVLGGMNQ